MNLAKFAREIHEQSVAHGWWENGDLIEKLTMIHSEISEAVDEYRNARPMVYVPDLVSDDEAVPRYETDWAKFDGRKPEGIAVELADMCIRIFDLMAHCGCEDVLQVTDLLLLGGRMERSLPHLAAELHDDVSGAYRAMRVLTSEQVQADDTIDLVDAVYLIADWLRNRKINLWDVMRLKHEYNKTRAYRHGGKKC